jgi:4a-hydroxytetrahydrobiopterin dehydratase
MTHPLAAQHCRPQDGRPPLDETEVQRHLATLPGWARTGRSIEKTYRFTDYRATMGFVYAVARIAEAEDHHPELVVGYDRCTVRFDTHSVGGLSINDFVCAAQVDALQPV